MCYKAEAESIRTKWRSFLEYCRENKLNPNEELEKYIVKE